MILKNESFPISAAVDQTLARKLYKFKEALLCFRVFEQNNYCMVYLKFKLIRQKKKTSLSVKRR